MTPKDNKACIDSIVKASKGTVSEVEAEDLLKEQLKIAKIQELRNQVISKEALQKMANDKAQAQVFDALYQQRVGLINKRVEKNFTKFMESWKDNPWQGFLAYLGGSIENRNLARKSLDYNIKALDGAYRGEVYSQLNQKGLWDTFNNNTMEVEVAQALEVLETPGGRLTDLDVPKEAKDIAETIHKVRDDMVQRLNLAGARIGKLQGFIASQSHNGDKIRRAAWDGRWRSLKDYIRPDVEKSFQVWRDAMWKHFNLEKSFAERLQGKPGDLRSLIDQELREDFNEKIAGKHISANGAEDYAGFTGYQNVAKKVSGHRTYLPRSAKDFIEYNNRYGSGGLSKSVMDSFEIGARNIGLMEGLGTNPKEMFEKILRKVEDERVKTEGKEVGSRFKRVQFLRNVLSVLDGTANIAEGATAAKIQSNIQGLVNMASLGGVAPHSISDLGTIAAELKRHGIDMTTTYPAMLKRLTQGRGTPELRRIANVYGLAMQQVLGFTNARFTNFDGVSGKLAQWQHSYFGHVGMHYVDDVNQTFFAVTMSNHLGEQASKAWGGLSKETQDMFGKHGIDERAWDLYRQTVWKSEDGLSMLTPDKVTEIPDEAISKDLLDSGVNATKNNIQRRRNELRTLFASFITDRSEIAVPKPGAVETAFGTAGLPPGSPGGIAMRMFSHLKMFAYSNTRKNVLLSGKNKEFGILLHNIAAGTLLTYLGYALTDIANNKEPRDLFDSKTLMDSFVKSGGGTVLGDYAFGTFKKSERDILSDLGGPEISKMKDLFDIYGRIKEGDDPSAASVRFIQGNLPYNNVAGVKILSDYLIFNQLKEWANPGSVSRSVERDRKENERDPLFFNPADVVR